MKPVTLFLLILLLTGCGGPATPADPAPNPPPGAGYPDPIQPPASGYLAPNQPGAGEGYPAAAGAASLTLTSPAFGAGEPIPVLYSCQGEDRSPALAWSEPPAGTQSLALLVDDPDAPGGTWTHWIVYNLPPATRSLPEGASAARGGASLPAGAQQGKNSFRRLDYGGPCPPSGTHRYFFYLYALDTTLSGELDRKGLLAAIEGHVLAQAELMGTYAK